MKPLLREAAKILALTVIAFTLWLAVCLVFEPDYRAPVCGGGYGGSGK